MYVKNYAGIWVNGSGGGTPLTAAALNNLELQYDDAVADAATDATGKVTAHTALTTGVHGVGAGTVAKVGDIAATKIDDLTAGDDNTDLNASTSEHGLVLKAVAPAAGLTNIVAIENGETIYKNKVLFDVTNPAALGTAAPGTTVIAARRDHVHLDTVRVHVAAADPHTQYPLKTILTTRGDLIYRGASDWGRLAKGAAGQVLTQGASDPAWATPYVGPTVQTNVTASRTLGTVYQNTTGLPMCVQIAVHMSGSGTSVIIATIAYADSSSSPTTKVGEALISYGGTSASIQNDSTITFTVLAGNYYKISSATGLTVVAWIETY